MQTGVEILTLAAGKVPEAEFFGEGEVTVRREGYSHSRHILLLNGKPLAKLRWYGMRRAVYESEGLKYEISVGALQRRICVISQDGSESVLIERSRANPRRRSSRPPWAAVTLRPASRSRAEACGGYAVLISPYDDGRRTLPAQD